MDKELVQVQKNSRKRNLVHLFLNAIVTFEISDLLYVNLGTYGLSSQYSDKIGGFELHDVIHEIVRKSKKT